MELDTEAGRSAAARAVAEAEGRGTLYHFAALRRLLEAARAAAPQSPQAQRLVRGAAEALPAVQQRLVAQAEAEQAEAAGFFRILCDVHGQMRAAADGVAGGQVPVADGQAELAGLRQCAAQLRECVTQHVRHVLEGVRIGALAVESQVVRNLNYFRQNMPEQMPAEMKAADAPAVAAAPAPAAAAAAAAAAGPPIAPRLAPPAGAGPIDAAAAALDQGHDGRWALDRLERRRELRKTIFGAVFLAEHRESREVVAVKLSSVRTIAANPDCGENPRREARIHAYVCSAPGGPHPNVMRLLGWGENQDHHYQVMELARGGELFDVVLANGLGPPDVRREYCRQFVAGVAAIHARGLAHLDLSLENAILSGPAAEVAPLKIIDFGMAVESGAGRTMPPGHVVGKVAYQAPEMLDGTAYDARRADMWSVGCVIFTMATGLRPCERANRADERFRIIIDYADGPARLLRAWRVGCDPNLTALLALLLCPAERRATAEEALRHPFLAE